MLKPVYLTELCLVASVYLGFVVIPKNKPSAPSISTRTVHQYSLRWWKPSAAEPTPAAAPTPPPTQLLAVENEGEGDEDVNCELVFSTSTKGETAKGMPSTKVSTSRMICGEMTG